MKRHVGWLSAVAVILILGARESAAQDKDKPKTTTAEDKARMARRGAGLTFGTWALVDDQASGGSTSDDSPTAEGYFRKGFDKHLALEATAGVWRRVITNPGTGGPFGSSGGTTTVFLVPQFTALKLYPFTGPEDKFEPFIAGGVGITFAIVSESGGGGLVGGGGGLSGIILGLGGRLTSGAEWRLGEAFGLSGGFHYTYNHFFDPVAGLKMYRGTGVNIGLTYRFQY